MKKLTLPFGTQETYLTVKRYHQRKQVERPRDASCLSELRFSSIQYAQRNLLLLSASLYVSKRGAY